MDTNQISALFIYFIHFILPNIHVYPFLPIGGHQRHYVPQNQIAQASSSSDQQWPRLANSHTSMSPNTFGYTPNEFYGGNTSVDFRETRGLQTSNLNTGVLKMLKKSVDQSVLPINKNKPPHFSRKIDNIIEETARGCLPKRKTSATKQIPSKKVRNFTPLFTQQQPQQVKMLPPALKLPRPDIGTSLPSERQRPDIGTSLPSERQRSDSQNQRPSETQRSDSQNQRPSETQRSDSQNQRPSETQRSDSQNQRPSETQRSDSQNQRPSETQRSDSQNQRPSETQRSDSQNQRPSETQRSDSQNQRPSETQRSDSQNQRPSETQRSDSQNQRPSETQRSDSQNQRPSETQRSDSQNQRPSETQRSDSQNQRPSETQRSDSQNQRPSETQRSDSQNQRPSETQRQRTEEPMPSTSQEVRVVKPLEICDKKLEYKEHYYTFVINDGITMPPQPGKTKTPTFIFSNHNDHRHIGFKCTVKNLSSRQNSIFKFLKINDKQKVASSRIQVEKILIDEFTSWVTCLNMYEEEEIIYIGKVDATFKGMSKNISQSSNQEALKQGLCPFKEGKPKKIEKNPTNREIEFDYIYDILEEKNARSVDKLKCSLCPIEFRFLCCQLGYNYEPKIKTVLDHKNGLIFLKQLKEPIIERFIILTPPAESIQEEWIKRFFNSNEIDIIEFLAWFIIIADKRCHKINTLVVYGNTNTGKSLVIRTLLENENYGYVVRNNGKLMFDNLVLKNFALLEEPIIKENVINELKLFFEGAEFEANIKNNPSKTLGRIPTFVTTNHKLESSLGDVDGKALKTRIKEFTFKKPIKHTTVEFPNYIEPLPDGIEQISKKHWAGIFKKNIKNIEDMIKDIMRG
ncbi:UNVERIFIED_CONTAM: hypothetical protein RMT77_017876 [Armadillidium vulgare]